MSWKKCSACHVSCWHNPTKEGERCTYCGTPAGGSTDKKANQLAAIDRQKQRATLLGITTSGIPNRA